MAMWASLHLAEPKLSLLLVAEGKTGPSRLSRWLKGVKVGHQKWATGGPLAVRLPWVDPKVLIG